MKFVLLVPLAWVCVVAVLGSAASARAQAPGAAQGTGTSADPGAAQPGKPVMEAEVLRMTTGRLIDASGLASKPFAINKGAHYDVVSESLADVILSRSGQKFRVPKADVKIYEKDPNAVDKQRQSPTGLVDASGHPIAPQDPKYIEAMQAEAARAAEAAAMATFKPGGELVITSARYSLSGNQPRNVKNKIEKMVPKGPLTALVKILVSDDLSRAAANQGNYTIVGSQRSFNVIEHSKNVLTVVYQYNGVTQTKQAMEGTTLFLP